MLRSALQRSRHRLSCRPHALATLPLHASASAARVLSSSSAPPPVSPPSSALLDSVLIANRGEIACRIIRTCARLRVRTIAVYSDADATSQHVRMADMAVRLGGSSPSQSYLNMPALLAAISTSTAASVHPGYGFLSENEAFAVQVGDAGVKFIGPPPAALKSMGSKAASKSIMQGVGVPVTPGYWGVDNSYATLCDAASRIGYPVMLKAVKGGGGKGMRIVRKESELKDAIAACAREAMASFGGDALLVEKYIDAPSHVEIQVFGDEHGNAVHLWERDCSVQRRHQKVVEEAPSPALTPALRQEMGRAAVAAAKAVGYVGAGTVEFMLDARTGKFWFMEMNTRLQVEHPVTEAITGLDLVEWQLRVASGAPLPMTQEEIDDRVRGHALEARVYAENSAAGFLPSIGTLAHLHLPAASEHVRVDTGVRQGDAVGTDYDPMIAKLIVWGSTRADAIRRMRDALSSAQVAGVHTNISFLQQVYAHPVYDSGVGINTSFLEMHGPDCMPVTRPAPRHVLTAAAVSAVMLQARQASGGDVWVSRPGGSTPATPAHSGVSVAWKDGEAAGSAHIATSSTRMEGDEVQAAMRVTLAGEAVDVTATSTPIPPPAGIPGFEAATRGRDMTPFGVLAFAVTLRSGGVVRSFTVVHMKGESIIVMSREGDFTLTLPQRTWGVSDAGAGGVTMRAPMPGKVVRVCVTAGASVKAGEPVIILEAMKMEHVIKAPMDGIVSRINADVGDLIADGKELVTFEREAAPPAAAAPSAASKKK